MINFLKYKWIYFLISSFVLSLGFFSLIKYGFNYSIDFTGGTILEYQFNKEVKKEKVRKIIEEKKIKVYSASYPSKTTLFIKTVPLDEKQQLVIKKKIEEKEKVKATLLRFETVGPKLGKETTIKTAIASATAILGILVYLTFAFRNIKYGLAAILAMIHDFFIMIGTYSLVGKFLGAEVDTLFITALLTTMSFSVHDTIVVFDKIREYRKIDNTTPFNIIANKALTETIIRSLNNSLTIILMLVALLLLGGETIKFFVTALLIGTITGTYSSPFIATPILEILEQRSKK